MANGNELTLAGPTPWVTPGGRRRKTKTPPADTIARLLSKLRGDPDALLSENDTNLPSSIDENPTDDPAWALGRAMGAHQRSPIDSTEDTPSALAGPNRAAGALYPQAPAPLDVSGIYEDEKEKLQGDRGFREKPNPKGIRGFGLAVLKGLIGAGEGYARSGARDLHGALPSMSAGIHQRVKDYLTNDEDSRPWDEEFHRRLQERLGPAQADYAAKRQTYDDQMQRYGIENAQEQQQWARGATEHAQRITEQGQQLEATRYRDALAAAKQRDEMLDQQRRDHDALEHEDRLKQIQATIEGRAQTSTDSNERARLHSRALVLSSQMTDLRANETPLVKQLATVESQLQDELSNEPDSTADNYATESARHQRTVASLQQRQAALNAQIEDIHKRRKDLVDASEHEFGSGGAAGGSGSALDRRRQDIKEKFNRGEITEADALAQLRATGLK